MMKLGGTYCKPNSVNSDLEICAHRGGGGGKGEHEFQLN